MTDSIVPMVNRVPFGVYWLAAACTVAALLFRLAFTHWIGDRPVLVLFILPILLSAYVGGIRPGLFCTALVAAVTDFFLIPPLDNFAFDRSVDLAQWLILILSGILVSILTGRLHRMNRALRETEDLFAKAFQLSPDCMMIMRISDRTVMRANDALCRLWERQPAEVIGRPTRELTAWPGEAERIAFMQELLLKGEILNREALQRMSDGRVRPFALSARVITQDGEPCVLCVLRDLTERRRAEAFFHEITAIVDSSDDAIIGKNLDGVITSWNSGAERIFGYTSGEMIGSSVMRIIPVDRQQEETHILEQIIHGTVVRHFETVRQHKDGSMVDISVTVSPIKDSHGTVVGASKIARDISERKRTEAAMRETNERFASMFNSSPVATSLTTIPGGEYVDVNEAFLKLFEVPREEVVGRNVFELNTWVDLKQREALFARIKENGAVHGFDMTLRNRSGKVIQLLWSGVHVVIDGKQCLLGSGLDITERRKMEQALRENEKLLHATDRRLAEILQGMTEACFALDADWRFTFVNDRGEALLRHRRAEMIGRSIWEVFHQLVGTPMEGNYRRAMEQRQPQAFEAFSPVAQRWLDVRLFPTPDGLAAFLMDISARKETDLEVRKSQAEFQDLFDHAPIGYHELDLEGRIVRINTTELNMLGYRREELLDRPIWSLLENPEESRIATLAKLRGAAAPMQFTRRFRCKDGTIVPVLVQDRTLRDESGAIRGSRAALQDITELKRREEEISQLNALLERRVAERTTELSDLYNNAPCGYHSLDAEGLVVRMNDTALHWLGYTREEVVGRTPMIKLLTPASAEVFGNDFPAFKARGRLENLELELVRKDGSILPVLLSATVVRDADGRFLMSRSTIADYTDRRQAERELRQSQAWLEAANHELEAFTYSVSHDLRAPLRAVDGFSQAVLEDYAQLLPPEGRRYLATIRESAQRMAELIDDLLSFSRLSRQALRRQTVSMDRLVRSTLADLQGHHVDRRIEFRIGELPTCDGDPALLKQVWLNLLANAVKYTRKREAAVVEVGCQTTAEGVVYFIRDNGTGFDMQYVHKLFGVFQRLHRAEEYEGTGVGLAIVQRVIHRHGGRVWAEGRLDQGATFFFTLSPPSKP